MLTEETLKTLASLECGWSLVRVAPTTYRGDLIHAAKNQGVPLTDAEESMLRGPAKQGRRIYRFRVGRGRYHWSENPNECVAAALSVPAVTHAECV